MGFRVHCTWTGRRFTIISLQRDRARGLVRSRSWPDVREKLGIKLIGPNSPQAKGGVERGHATHQDRLIKKMRLQEIDQYETANEFLLEAIAPNTIHVVGQLRRMPIITCACRRVWIWSKCSVWRKNAKSAKTGWCKTSVGGCRLKRKHNGHQYMPAAP